MSMSTEKITELVAEMEAKIAGLYREFSAHVLPEYPSGEDIRFLERMLTALRQMQEASKTTETCTWEYSEDVTWSWETSCGTSFQFNDGGPIENEFNFCHHCGKRIAINPPQSTQG